MSMAFYRMCGANKNDTIYLTLPLYHMAASLLGIGGCIDLGMDFKVYHFFNYNFNIYV